MESRVCHDVKCPGVPSLGKGPLKEVSPSNAASARPKQAGQRCLLAEPAWPPDTPRLLRSGEMVALGAQSRLDERAWLCKEAGLEEAHHVMGHVAGFLSHALMRATKALFQP